MDGGKRHLPIASRIAEATFPAVVDELARGLAEAQLPMDPRCRYRDGRGAWMPWIVRKTGESGRVDLSRGRVLLAVLAGYLPAVWTALLLTRASELLLYGELLGSRSYDAIEWQLTFHPLLLSLFILPGAYWAASWALEMARGTWWKLALPFSGLGVLFMVCVRISGVPTPERGELLSIGLGWAAGGALYGLLIWLVCLGPSAGEDVPR